MRFFKVAAIIALAVILSLAAAVGAAAGGGDFNALEGLAERYGSFRSLAFFSDTFGVASDAVIYVESAEDENLFDTVNSFAEYEGVRQLVWYGSFSGFFSLGIEVGGADYLRENLGDGTYRYLVVCLLEYSPFCGKPQTVLDRMTRALEGKKVVEVGLTCAVREPLKVLFSEKDISLIGDKIAIAVPVKPIFGTHNEYISELKKFGAEAASFYSIGINEAAVTYLLTETALVEYAGCDGLIGEAGGSLWTLYAVQAAPETEALIKEITEKYFGDAYFLSYSELKNDARKLFAKALGWALFSLSAASAAAVVYISARKKFT